MIINIETLENNGFTVDIDNKKGIIYISAGGSHELFDKLHDILYDFGVPNTDSGQIIENTMTQINNRKIMRLCE